MIRCKDCVHSIPMEDAPIEFQDHYRGYRDLVYCSINNVSVNMLVHRNCKDGK